MPAGGLWCSRGPSDSSIPHSASICSASSTQAGRIAGGSDLFSCPTNFETGSKPCSVSTTGRSRSRISGAHRPSGNVHWHADAGSATSFTPLQIASAYGFPPGTGEGECVAIIELGGGERTADLTTYFSRLGISPGPSVIAVSVDHGTNTPTGDPNGPDGEVMLDIEVAGAVAPQAQDRGLFRGQHGCRVSRRDHDRDP